LRPSGIVIAILGALGALAAPVTPGIAQESAGNDPRWIDRWLVAAVAPPTPGQDPLAADGVRLFPDRDIEVGPGVWALAREDGADRLSLDRFVEPRPMGATATLAHAYVRPTAEITAALSVQATCPITVWLNGQEMVDASRGIAVRLAAGWNTLLVALSDEDGCAPDLGVRLGPPEVPTAEDEPAWDASTIRVQASRPPGARPTYPVGFLQPGRPAATHMTWDASRDRLLVELAYSLTSWGAGPAVGEPTRGEAGAPAPRPTGGPTVDASGEWSLRFFTPSGILNADAILEMSADGELTGRIEGDINSDIRQGWVSGNEIGWVMRFPDLRRDRDAEVRGTIEDGRMSGSFGLAVGGFRTRFEGRRRGGGGDEPEGERSPPGADRPGERGPARPGGGGRGDITFPPGDEPVDRDLILRRLRPPAVWVDEPAPGSGSIRLSVRGGELAGGVDGLWPTVPSTLSGALELDRVRQAALEPRSVEARVRWSDDEHRFRGRLDPADILTALHRPIALTGWSGTDPAALEGRFRVPDALGGFTLEVLDGTWSLGGSPLEGKRLCSPCRRGERLDIRVTGTDRPFVRIVDPGYPSAGPGAPAARVWLEALRGDNEEYRRLGAQGSGSSSPEGSAPSS